MRSKPRHEAAHHHVIKQKQTQTRHKKLSSLHIKSNQISFIKNTARFINKLISFCVYVAEIKKKQQDITYSVQHTETNGSSKQKKIL